MAMPPVLRGATAYPNYDAVHIALSERGVNVCEN